MVSTLMADDLAIVSTAAGHYFSTYISTIDWHWNPVQYAALGPSELSACW